MSMQCKIDPDPKVAFTKVYQKALGMGLTWDDLRKLKSLDYIKRKRSKIIRGSCAYLFFGLLVVTLVFALLISSVLKEWPLSSLTVLETFWMDQDDLIQIKCLVQHDEFVQSDLLRPIADCDACRNVHEVDRVANITQEEFEAKYAYSKRPVVITDGMRNWTAQTTFNFKYFQGLYYPGSPALLNSDGTSCYFFPYKTNFENLGEVFEMSEDRANLKDGTPPWYIGWSNCEPSVSAELRTHYRRPYFLPSSSEDMRTDWIFMGSPGYGAQIHIDNVNNPSWQAQIAGRKVWTLQPPLECALECPRELKATINSGEIIVIDTNFWYHGTLVISDDISITIGSEYD